MTKLTTFDSNSKIYPSVSLVLVEAQRDQIRNAQNAAANTRRPAGKFHNCALPVISCAVDQTIGISKRKENQTPKASPRKKKNFYENGRYRKWREKASDGYITRALILIHSDNFHTLFDFFENKKHFFSSSFHQTPTVRRRRRLSTTTVSKRNCANPKRPANGSVFKPAKETTAATSSNAHPP